MKMELIDKLKSRVERYWYDVKNHDPFHRAIFEGRVTSQMMSHFLVNVHYLVQHTPLHLKRAIAKAKEIRDPKLVEFFQTKFHEEQGHDKWAEDDLRKLRSKEENKFDKSVIDPTMKALIKHIESTIDRDPYLYLSYIFFAEYLCVICGNELSDALEQKCGFPPKSITIIENHAELDQDHVHEWEQIMVDLVVEERYRDPFQNVLESTIKIHEKFYQSCAERSAHAVA